MPANTSQDTRKPWYSKGIRFACARTGNCCTAHGEYGHVYISDEEAAKIAALLAVEVGVFERLHCTTGGSERELDMSSGTCPFLKERQCSIYAARPIQCRTWPFWRGNLEQKVWEREVKPFCKGVGRGPVLSQEEIDALADRHPDC